MIKTFSKNSLPHDLVKLCLSGYRKHTVLVCVTGDTDEIDHASGWDEGSRHFLTGFNIAGQNADAPVRCQVPRTETRVVNNGGWHDQRTYHLSPGTIAIETGTFCGKPATATLYITEHDFNGIFGGDYSLR